MRQGLAEEHQAFPRLLKTQALPVFLAVAVVLNATACVGIFMSPLGSSYYKEIIRAGHVAGTREQLDLSDTVAAMDDGYTRPIGLMLRARTKRKLRARIQRNGPLFEFLQSSSG